MSAQLVTLDRGVAPAPIRRGTKVIAFAIGVAVAVGPYLLLRPRLAAYLGTPQLASVADHDGRR